MPPFPTYFVSPHLCAPIFLCPPPPRDVAWLGDCDEGCLALAELLGWKVRPQNTARGSGEDPPPFNPQRFTSLPVSPTPQKELQELVRKEHAAIDAVAAPEDTSSASGGDPTSRRGRTDGSGGRAESGGASSEQRGDGKEP